jgi:hypothetical protein
MRVRLPYSQTPIFASKRNYEYGSLTLIFHFIRPGSQVTMPGKK